MHVGEVPTNNKAPTHNHLIDSDEGLALEISPSQFSYGRGGSRGSAHPLLAYFYTKLRSEGPKKVFFEAAPPLPPPPIISGYRWSGSPSPLSWRSGSATVRCLIYLIKPTKSLLACENSHLFSLLAARGFSPGETSAPQRQKFHTDDVKSVQNVTRSSDWSTN